MARAPLRVFYSYSHHDRRMRERLYAHMVMLRLRLRRDGLITEWYDGAIDSGSEWRDEIARELDAAGVILLLVSAAFLASDFCYEQEMLRAVERAHRGDALVIGVMLRAVDGGSVRRSRSSRWCHRMGDRSASGRMRTTHTSMLSRGSGQRSGSGLEVGSKAPRREPRSQATPPADDDILQ
jgi:hypothetical protein